MNSNTYLWFPFTPGAYKISIRRRKIDDLGTADTEESVTSEIKMLKLRNQYFLSITGSKLEGVFLLRLVPFAGFCVIRYSNMKKLDWMIS